GLDRGLRVIQPSGRAQDSVQYFALHAIAVLVENSQLWLGEPADSALAIVVQPGGGHPVRAVDASWDVLAPCRAHAARPAEAGAFLGGPDRTLRSVVYVGHPIPQAGRCTAGEEIGGEPAEIDVTVGRDHLVTHRRASSRRADLRVVILPDQEPARH